MKRFLPFILLSLLVPLSFAAGKDKKDEPPKPAQSTDELRQQLEKILKDTHTPGTSVAIVHRDGPEWVAGVGKSDVAANREVTPETLFRIGSTSKAFASMAILLLADQGKLSLNDPVRNLAPEVWFENRWEINSPVRVVNLLEHTTGWDDMHLHEYAKDAPPTMGLREALDYDHHSRISRWPPGTRMAYCNSGPAVAAYIVEKLTNQRFEDFVEQNLLRPIGMNTATYFPPPPGTATTLYHGDGKTPYRYWNILYRPAGSINASAQDMAAYVQFYLNRGMVFGDRAASPITLSSAQGAASGKVNLNSGFCSVPFQGSTVGTQVLPSADIDRMENPTSTWAAKEGLKSGYGLSNYWSFHDGFVWHGHNGGVEGGLTEMAYMPDYAVGYFFSINSGSGDAFDRVGKAIRAYITSKLQKPPLPSAGSLSPSTADYAGWYEPDSPRNEMTHFIEKLAGISHVRFADGKLFISNLGGWNETFLPVTGTQFRYVPKKDPPEPAASVVLLAPREEGRFIEAGFTVMKQIPAWLAFFEMALTAYIVLAIASILLYAPFWILGGLSKKRRRPAERGMRLWPLVAVLSVAAIVGDFVLCADDLIVRMGNLTAWSVAFYLATLLFAIASVASAFALSRAPSAAVRRGVRLYSIAVTVALLIAVAYLSYWGVIGLRVWA